LKGTTLYVGISVLQSKSGLKEVTLHIRPLFFTELRYQHTKLSPSREATPHIRPLFDIAELRYQHTKWSPSREVTLHIRPLFNYRTEIPTYKVVPFKRGHPSYKATF
jgi:hypothetical protein